MAKENQEMSNTSEFLKPTELCDWDNPDILRRAEEITEDSKTQKEAALKIFYFIRDEIVFGINDSKTKASQALKNGFGDCGSKTNLHVAFLRASGIPARYHLSKCRSDALKGIIPKWLFNRMPEVVSHFWPEVYLSEKWIACEGMLDQDLYIGLLKRDLLGMDQIPAINWDGENDTIILKPWLVEDRGTTAFYEEIYGMMDRTRKEEGMPPRIVERLFGWVIYSSFRRHTDRIRKPLL
ncbi:MAG: transglutaminase family protein [Candidatus Thorarchaeota archaeon]